MRKTKKRRSSSPFNRLPDELLLEILNKLIDLKTLCICKLVSKSFFKMVHQIDTISFTVPSDFNWETFDSETFWSAVLSMKRFRSVNSLHIELPKQKQLEESIHLFKWKVNLTTRVDSFVFLSPNTIYDKKELVVEEQEQEQEQEQEDSELSKKKIDIGLNCLKDAIARFVMVLHIFIHFPLLEKVFIPDSAKRGRICLNSRGRINEVRDWLSSYSPPETADQRRSCCFEVPRRLSKCYVPLLELPVSGYVMKGVTLFLAERERNELTDGDYSFVKIGENDLGFEEKDETGVYSEAVMEIFKKHRERIERIS